MPVERKHSIILRVAIASLALLAACADQPTAPAGSTAAPRGAPRVLATLDCQVTLATRRVTCGPAASDASRALRFLGLTYVKLTSSNPSYGGGIFQFDATVQNLLTEGIGTPDGVAVDPAGIRVFFHSGPVVTSGSGSVSVANADGMDSFTGANQPYFVYGQKLAHDEVSSARTWQIAYDPGVNSFAFTVYVAAEVQPLLVINEVLANPGGTILDADGEWFEVYNAGTLPVDMQGMLISDSAASGWQPYHTIGSSVSLPGGGYAVLGRSADTTVNGGVPVSYAYGAAISLANSTDALRVARVFNGATLVLDRTRYASAAISAKNGISRELENPAASNADMDDFRWDDALSTAVYGAGGRGTPGAQNSTFVP